jgi:hypothetical protein
MSAFPKEGSYIAVRPQKNNFGYDYLIYTYEQKPLGGPFWETTYDHSGKVISKLKPLKESEFVITMYKHGLRHCSILMDFKNNPNTYNIHYDGERMQVYWLDKNDHFLKTYNWSWKDFTIDDGL